MANICGGFQEDMAAIKEARLKARADMAEKLAEALRYYRDECSGQEPSLSVFHRMLDEALSEWDALNDGADIDVVTTDALKGE